MKLRIVPLIAIVLALCFILIGCGDKFKGDYKEITSEQKTEYSEKVSNVKKEVEKENMKTTIMYTFTDTGVQGNEINVTIKGTCLVDKTDANNFKYSGDFDLSNGEETRVCKLKVYYTDNDDKVYVDFTYHSSVEDDVTHDYSVTGTINKDNLNEPDPSWIPFGIDMFMGFAKLPNTVFDPFVEMKLTDDKKMYVDGDKIKIVEIDKKATNHTEVYINTNKNDFGIQLIGKSTDENGNDDGKSESIFEISLTNDTVTIPEIENNIGYVYEIYRCIMLVMCY